MLTTLCIEHFTIVKHLELDFTDGMTAFTGETGAGKSIMIDALLLALGERADASVIRPGADKCDITARFSFDMGSEPALWLASHDMHSEEGAVYLRRVIFSEGRSKSYINGQPFPLQKIKELSELLVLIHGQHQHHTLMHHATHRQQLDDYANHGHLLHKVATLYKDYCATKQAITALQNQEQQTDKIKLLQFQMDELDALHLHDGEIEALSHEHQMLHHAKDYLERGQQINHILNGDDYANICSGLNQIMQLSNQLPKENAHIKNAIALIHEAVIQCEEAQSEIEQFVDHIQIDPERLHTIEERMGAIHHLARKYHVDSSMLLRHKHELQEELTALQNTESRLSDLELELEHQLQAYNAAALTLRQSRADFAQKLTQELTASIQKLGMPKGWIRIDMTALDKLHAHGLDKIEYKVCTNPGMEPDSLSKIASGGELSRIGLAIQMITAQRGLTPTLLFDEVDVGIGGATAALVGQMLRKLGERLQVFCVTHQPQVAAAAHQHFLVEKQSDGNQTSSQITPLKPTQKIDEIARMLGGLTITEQTLSHAKELLELSNESI